MLRKVAGNTFWQVAAKGVSVLFTLLATILLTSYLGKEGYGRYMYVMTMAVLLGNLADWGTGLIGVRELAKAEKPVEVFGQIFGLRFTLAFLVGSVLVMAGLIESVSWLILAGLIVFLTSLRSSLGLIFQARLKMARLIPAEIVSGSLFLGWSYFLIQKKAGLDLLLWAAVGAMMTAVVMNWFLAKREIRINLRCNQLKWSVLLTEALPMGAILLLFTTVNKVDTLILAYLKGPAAVGVYALTYRVYDVLILGAAYLMSSFLPLLTRAHQEEKWQLKVREIIKKGGVILSGGGMVVLGGTLIAAPLIIQLLTQKRFEEFKEAISVLRILAVAVFLAHFNHLTGYTLVALGQQKKYLKIPVLALILNIGLNFLLVPRWSYFAAAWVTVVTEIVVLSWSIMMLKRVLRE